jgi:hypothetical protein
MIVRFLETLERTGYAEITARTGPVEVWIAAAGSAPDEVSRCHALLARWHREAVADLPGPPLPLDVRAAFHGALLLFRAACLAAFREPGENVIRDLLADDLLPAADDPAAHFSADLCLRHWPRLCRMARACAEDDPLVVRMREIAAAIPLSALGLETGATPAAPCFRHPGLFQWFAERAVALSDHAALTHPETAAFIRAKLGAFTSLLTEHTVPATPLP